jgi:2,4-dienoyl-CoA reductase-like NADH-dependent reductase (Old Yellow Enzyme family)
MQISHCGRQTRSKITALPTVAPSALQDAEDKYRIIGEILKKAKSKLVIIRFWQKSMLTTDAKTE